MKVTTKTRYGIRAMIEIAQCKDDSGIFQKDISKNQEISNKYLDHIIHGLKVASLIRKSGKKGGYILTKHPSEITMYDINSAFEPRICIVECLENGLDCPRENICTAQGFWGKLNSVIITHYKSTTLNDLIQKSEVT